ncbi:hypothetical protein NFI96_009191 [Prochilodus magdalenae]|nr:hypothetical protein NFI96_009191 [Prochilodus magdalenae]
MQQSVWSRTLLRRDSGSCLCLCVCVCVRVCIYRCVCVCVCGCVCVMQPGKCLHFFKCIVLCVSVVVCVCIGCVCVFSVYEIDAEAEPDRQGINLNQMLYRHCNFSVFYTMVYRRGPTPCTGVYKAFRSDTVHKCLALYTYSRQALLDIAAQNWKFTGQIPPELQHIVRPESHRHHPHEGPGPTTSSEYADPRIALRRRRRKRGKRGGLHARLKARASRPPLPSLLLANVRSLENKLDELRARITSQREVRECCALIFSETWLSETVPDSAVQLETHSLHRGDRTAASDLEFLLLRCRPFYLPREFTCVFLAAVYIHPRANYTAALSKLYDVISALETAHPDAVFIVAGDFNQCNLRTVLTKYHQHVDIPTRGKNTLDHVYSNIRGGLKAARRPSFGDSDHISLFMYPVYRQRLKQSDPVSRQVQLWTPEAESTLQDCFATTDWDVFRAAATLEDSSVSIDDYAEYVTGYIHTCIENIVPIIQVRKFPNQKPWVNSEVLQMLRARSVAFKSGDETELKVAQYKLKKAIRSAKRQHREKTERLYSTADPRRMWQCLDQITDFRSRPGNIISSSGSLPDDLNAFYTRFETPTPTTPTEYTHTSTTRPPPPPTSRLISPGTQSPEED